MNLDEVIDVGELEQLQELRRAKMAQRNELLQQLGEVQNECQVIDTRIRYLRSGHLAAEHIARQQKFLTEQQRAQEQASAAAYAEQQRKQQVAQQAAQEAQQRTSDGIKQREAQNTQDMKRRRQQLIDDGYLVP